jgi:class 3 adenylate cyclase/predicted ATPase
MTQNLNSSQIDRIKRYLPVRVSQEIKPRISAQRRRDLQSSLAALRQGISAYLPQYLTESIRNNPKPGQAGCFFKTGTVMFADVSGFTAMSEKLSALGKEGAEEMTGIVNSYFEAMLEISGGLGGDLLKFGGDALMIFYEGDSGAQRALSAGTSMQAAMSRFVEIETSQGAFPLRMSIGMASGPIVLLNLGSEKEMFYTVMGRTLGRMAKMEEQATAKQVVVDKFTAQSLQGHARFDEITKGAFVLKELTQAGDSAQPEALMSTSQNHPPEESSDILAEMELLEALSPYVPEELLVRLIADPNHPVRRGSHRQVTNVFANFIGLDEIVEDLGLGHQKEILEIADAYIAPMGQILDRYGGTISRLDTYSVGQRILALFGALQAHEDDPERAVRAGVEMNRALGSVNQKIRLILAGVLDGDGEPIGIRQRIGINTGFVFAGSVGSPRRREYTVMGAQVNLTARLMSIAKEGDVLIGGSTARHIESSFTLEEQEAVKVKGISKPVRNYVVGGEVAAQSRLTRLAATPIQGREQELQLSRKVSADVLEGRGRTLVISGESGIGKSRLIDEIVTEVIASGMDVVDGACLSFGRTMTYHPWAEILRDLFGMMPDQEPAGRIRYLTDHMEKIGQDIFVPLIGQVMGLPIEDNDLTRDLDPKLRRQRVLDLVLQLLQARSSMQPLLILIEDAHWADDASRDLISYVGRNIGPHPILFLLSHRPDEDLPDWSELPGAHGVALSGLSAEACLALARQILGDQPISERLELFILEKGDGNPLFLGEVIRNLMDTGGVAQDSDGVWDLPEGIEAVELPDTIHGMIISRMDRLEPSDRRMLQVASVVGRSFSTPTLVGVYDFDLASTDLSSRIGYLANRGLVELMEGGEQLFRFTHLTTQEVVYESLSFELKRDLHCRIGTHYEEVHSDSLNEWIDLLAYHYYEGHEWPKAATHNLQAGQRAQREFANQAAISACQKVLSAAEKLRSPEEANQTALPAHETLGEVHTLVGEYDQALDHLGLAKGILDIEQESEENTRSMADLLRKTADIYERQGEYGEAFQWLERALEGLEGISIGLETARIHLMGAGIHHRQGQNDEAVAWCLRSSKTASKINSRESARVMAQAHYLQGAALYRQAKFDEALRACEESIRLFDQIEDLLGSARAYNNLAIVYSDLGDWEKSSEAYHKSLEINQRIGNIQEQGFVANNLGNIHLYRGEWEQAIALIRESNGIWKKIGAPLPDAVTLSNLAQVQIYKREWDKAKITLDESQAIFDGLGSEDFMAELERRWAEYLLGIKESESALKHINHSIELAVKQEARLEEGMSYRVLGEIEHASGDHEAAEQALLKSLQILEGLNSEYQEAKTKHALARLGIIATKLASDYTDELRAAIKTFENLGAKADLKMAQGLLKRS